MPTFTTEGIILKRSNFGEADRILTIMTPFRGKIKVLAKGVRRITSRRGGNVEILNRVKLYLFKGQGFNILTEAEALETFSILKEDLILSTYSSHLVELIDRFIPENQMHNEAYNLLLATLHVMSKNPRKIFVRAFEVKLLSELGFWSRTQIDADEETKDILKKLEVGGWGEIAEMKLSENQSVEVGRILRYYMEKVLEGSLKSLDMIEKLKERE